jgi:hypothetical protein
MRERSAEADTNPRGKAPYERPRVEAIGPVHELTRVTSTSIQKPE